MLSDADLGRKLWWAAHQMKRQYRDAGYMVARLYCRERGLDPDALEIEIILGGWTPSRLGGGLETNG